VLNLHTIVKRLVYLWFIHLLTLLLGVAAQAAFAQEQINYLALNGTLEDDIGPYYFRAEGNVKDAYVQLNLLAEKLGYSYSYDGLEVVLKNNYRTIELKTTNNVVMGLEKRPDVLSINGGFIESPMGIVVNDVAYGAVTPVIRAMGGAVDWHNDNGERLVYINYDPSVDIPKTEPVQSSAQPTAPATVQTSGGTLGSPRVASHADGYTRVAIDLPANSFYEVYAEGTTLLVTLPQLGATPFTQNFPNDPNIENVRYALVDNKVALIVTTRYTLQAAGVGYKFALLEADATGNERFYIDFSPSLTGTAVKSAQGMQVQDMSSAQMPTAQQKVVLIDPGHGGRDPGTLSDWAVEKEVVLSISLKVKAYLEAYGIQVQMTRSDDTFPELEQRANAATTDINLFVSIHANAAAATKANGIETWVFGEPLNDELLAQAIRENGGGAEGQARTQEAINVAQGITKSILGETQLAYSKDLAGMVQSKMIAATGAKDRGVRSNSFYILRNAQSPAILIETGFVSNAEEGPKLATDSYQDTLARAIAEGIVQFFGAGTTVAATQQQP
jgi:N-acetylmuramoyl-L-alanine amidase